MRHSQKAIALFVTTSLLSSFTVFEARQAVWGQSTAEAQSQPTTPAVKRKGLSKKAKDLIQDGIHKLEVQQFRAALAIFQQVQKDYPTLKKKERVTLLDYLGQTYLYIDEPNKAKDVLEEALEIYRDRKNKQKIADTLVRIARASYKYPDEAKAYAHLEEALKLYQELGDRAGEANVVFAKTMVDTRVGPLFHTKVRTENLEVLYTALELMKEAGDRHGEGRVQMAIGEAYYDTLDDYESSHASLRKALRIFQAEGDTYHEIITIWLIGYVYNAKKEYPKAIETYQKAIALAQKQGHIDTELFIHEDLGGTYERIEKFSNTIATLQEALKLAQKTDKKFKQGTILLNLGKIYRNTEQYSKSLSSYQQARLALWNSRERKCQSDKIAALGEAYRQSPNRNIPKAIEQFEKALDIEQKKGTAECEFLILDKLSTEYDLAGEINQVLNIAQRTLDILETSPRKKFQDNYDLELLLYSLAHSPSFGNNSKAYEPVLQTSYRAAKHFGNERIIQKNLIELGHLHRNLENESKMLDYYHQGFLVFGDAKDYACQTQSEFAQGLAYRERSKKSSKFRSYITEKDTILKRYSKKAIQTLESALEHETNHVCKIILLNQLNQLYQSQLNVSGIIKNISQIRVALQSLDEPTFKESEVAIELVDFLDKNTANVKTSFLFRDNADNPNPNNQDLFFSDSEITVLQDVLEIAKRLENKGFEFVTLGSLSTVYEARGEYRTALDFAEEGLSLAEENYILNGKINFLTTLGSLHSLVGDYVKSNQYYENSVTLQRQLSHWTDAASSLVALAENKYFQGDFDQAIILATQAVDIIDKQKANNTISLSTKIKFTLSDLKSINLFLDATTWMPHEIPATFVLSSSYAAQGKMEKALQSINQELKALGHIEVETQKLLNHHLKSKADNPLANPKLHKQKAALEPWLKKLKGDRKIVFQHIFEHRARQKFNKAQDKHQLNRLKTGLLLFVSLEQGLKIARGNLHYQSGDLAQAMTDYQQGVSFYEGDLSLKRLAYLGLARVYRDMNLPTVSANYYKKVIQSIELKRGQIQELPEALQASFLNASFELSQTPVGDIYRELADLLIAEGRIAEAQEILELLKQKELNEFTKGTRAEKKLPEISFSLLDQQINQKQDSLTQLGQKLLQCKIERCPEVEISALRTEQRQLQATFIQEMKAIEASLSDRRLTQVSTGKRDFVASAQKLVKAQPDSMLIYPLVLKDKIHLLWASSGGVFSSKTCPLGEAAAWTLIAQFRQLLSTPKSDVASLKATGQKLYACLVQPLESEIAAGEIKHLIFVPDRATNYIPMAALYDGQQFLAEKYITSSVLSAGLTDVEARLPDSIESTSTLALGVSKAIAGFNSLPNVTKELDAIVKEDSRDQGIFPGDALLDQNFDQDTLYNQLNGQQILHIATHGEFIPEDPKASYLLTGTGKKLPIYELEFLETLRDVHLVVLSACETALGGPDQNGIEIAGISSYFLQDKAKAVLASLWQVNDDSTNQLMQAFYQNLSMSNGGNTIGKGEVLRRAQMSLLKGQSSSLDQTKRGRIVIRDKENLIGN